MSSRKPCPTRKARYYDRIGALIALSRLHSQDKPGHHEIRAYRCPRCGGWHLAGRGSRWTAP